MSITGRLSPALNSIVHALVALLAYAIPLILAQHQQVADMTVSSIVLLVLKYIDETVGTVTPTPPAA